jgi:DNA helicase-2/ATP-dependent DNA helicase PcrA
MLEAVRRLIETDELKPRPRSTLRELAKSFERWSSLIETMKHSELAEQILEESGYTDMWQKERTADSAGRLENLKELVRSMEEFPDLAGFLEHVSLVMEMSDNDSSDRVSIMTLHGAKGLEFETVFLPGWEEGLFPNQRALDENGRAGLEEERRLAYVGLTRARRRAKLYFASNRRIHGLWSATVPSRFIDELPPEHVEVMDAPAGFASGQGGYGRSRFDQQSFGGSSYQTPGWQRAQQRGGSTDRGPGGRARVAGGYDEDDDRNERRDDAQRGRRFSSDGFSERAEPYRAPPARRGTMLIEGELVAKSTGSPSRFNEGDRVFHIKFGNGSVASIDGNKLTIDFDKAGRKMVLDSFVEKSSP